MKPKFNETESQDLMRYFLDTAGEIIEIKGRDYVKNCFSDPTAYAEAIRLEFELDPQGRRRFMDIVLRDLIGKTDDITVSLCSHAAIINREFGEHFCRVCHKECKKGVGMYNDHLLIMHRECRQPICSDCAEERPDEFHKAFRAGTKQYQRIWGRSH